MGRGQYGANNPTALLGAQPVVVEKRSFLVPALIGGVAALWLAPKAYSKLKDFAHEHRFQKSMSKLDKAVASFKKK